MLNSPFTQAGATRNIAKGLLKTNKFSFNGIITNLEKTVSTINQVVPLYNQVRPLISNSKTIINSFKSTSKKQPKKNSNKKDFNPDIINVDINKSSFTKKNQNLEKTTVFTNVDTPTKPFFI